MPELPEVETQVRSLNKTLKDRKIVSVEPVYKKAVKKPKNFSKFKNTLKGLTIKKIERIGKNIIFYLSNGKILLMHQKISGHLLYGNFRKKGKLFESIDKNIKSDPKNRFIIFLFGLDNKKYLALCDPRKFSKIELWQEDEFKKSNLLKNIGVEPLSKKFTRQYLENILKDKNRPIKTILLDQSLIAGIGNIYSDEILWEAKIHPFKKGKNISKKEVEKLFKAIKKILKEGIKRRGESFSDWRDIFGRKGFYDKYKKVFKREGEKCKRCNAIIKRIKIGGRSSRFCPKCQQL